MALTRYYLFATLLLLLPTAGMAQNDTFYLDKDLKRTVVADAKYYRVYHLISDHYYKVNDYDMKSNGIRVSGHCTSIDSISSTGKYFFYDDSGLITSEGNYEDNSMTGDWKYYYPNTTYLWHVATYMDDSIILLTSYYKSGKLKREERNNIIGIPTGKCFDEQGKDIPFTAFYIRARPAYILNDYLAKKMHYPKKARKDNIEGRAVIKFAVDESGNILEPEVVESLRQDCDNEALRVVKSMPRWIPGTMDDVPVKIYFNLPIRFKLED